MKPWKKPLLLNLAIGSALVLFDLLFIAPEYSGPFGRLAFSGTLILLLVPVNLVVGMVRNRNKKKDGPYYLLMAGLMLLVGFSVCTIS